jgi:hypothetical protein
MLRAGEEAGVEPPSFTAGWAVVLQPRCTGVPLRCAALRWAACLAEGVPCPALLFAAAGARGAYKERPSLAARGCCFPSSGLPKVVGRMPPLLLLPRAGTRSSTP